MPGAGVGGGCLLSPAEGRGDSLTCGAQGACPTCPVSVVLSSGRAPLERGAGPLREGPAWPFRADRSILCPTGRLAPGCHRSGPGHGRPDGLPAAWGEGAAWLQRPRLVLWTWRRGAWRQPPEQSLGAVLCFREVGVFSPNLTLHLGLASHSQWGPSWGGTRGAPAPPPAPTPPGVYARGEDLRPGYIAPWLRPRMRGSWGPWP